MTKLIQKKILAAAAITILSLTIYNAYADNNPLKNKACSSECALPGSHGLTQQCSECLVPAYISCAQQCYGDSYLSIDDMNTKLQICKKCKVDAVMSAYSAHTQDLTQSNALTAGDNANSQSPENYQTTNSITAQNTATPTNKRYSNYTKNRLQTARNPYKNYTQNNNSTPDKKQSTSIHWY